MVLKITKPPRDKDSIASLIGQGLAWMVHVSNRMHFSRLRELDLTPTITPALLSGAVYQAPHDLLHFTVAVDDDPARARAPDHL